MRTLLKKFRLSILTRLLGFDPSTRIQTLEHQIAAIHLAISDAMLDLSEESKDAVRYHTKEAAREIIERNDLVVERVDRKAEGYFSELNRRLTQVEAELGSEQTS